MQEKIIETKVCKLCNSKFEITDKDLEFYDKISPKFNGEKFQIPAPNLCPDCRNRRRLSFRNERKLYKRKCSLTGKDMISIYSPDKILIVYENKVWWSDKFDGLDYGVDFDFNKTFSEQYKDLLLRVPRINLYIQNEENSPYSNFESDMKNCYMTIGGHWNNNCMYGMYNMNSTDSLDNYWLFKSSNAYESIYCYNIYKCFYLQKSTDCNNCFLGYDLKSCSDCFGCVGLRDKKYHIFNEKYTENEYKQKLEELNPSNHKNLEKLKQEFYNLYLKVPHINLNIIGSENCSGDDIYNSKNTFNSFCVEDVENCKHGLIYGMGKNSMDLSSIGMMEYFYECASGGMHGFNNFFTQFSYTCKDVFYADNCHYSSNLFACIGLKNKQYCIFNKQYEKSEYEKQVAKIIKHMQKTGEWGEFFPSNLSLFGYNETVADEYYPLEKEEALKKGFNWSDYQTIFPKVEKIIRADMLPDNINDIPDDILNRAIECEVTKKPFKIIAQELEFYRKHNLPIPRKHPDRRHLDRMKLRNPIKMWDRKCDKCSKEIQSTYSPERKEIVYCEECYNKEVY